MVTNERQRIYAIETRKEKMAAARSKSSSKENLKFVDHCETSNVDDQQQKMPSSPLRASREIERNDYQYSINEPVGAAIEHIVANSQPASPTRRGHRSPAFQNVEYSQSVANNQMTGSPLEADSPRVINSHSNHRSPAFESVEHYGQSVANNQRTGSPLKAGSPPGHRSSVVESVENYGQAVANNHRTGSPLKEHSPYAVYCQKKKSPTTPLKSSSPQIQTLENHPNTYHVNIYQDNRRIRPKLILSPDTGYLSLSSLVLQVLSLRASDDWVPVAIKVLGTSGLVVVSDEANWQELVTEIKEVDWLDGEVKCLVEVGSK